MKVSDRRSTLNHKHAKSKAQINEMVRSLGGTETEKKLTLLEFEALVSEKLLSRDEGEELRKAFALL